MSPRDRACALVYDYTKRSLEGTDKHTTTLPDNMYYEVTHNAAKAETYVDAYMKFDNVAVPD